MNDGDWKIEVAGENEEWKENWNLSEFPFLITTKIGRSMKEKYQGQLSFLSKMPLSPYRKRRPKTNLEQNSFFTDEF